jgi:hypothetical protein
MTMTADIRAALNAASEPLTRHALREAVLDDPNDRDQRARFDKSLLQAVEKRLGIEQIERGVFAPIKGWEPKPFGTLAGTQRSAARPKSLRPALKQPNPDTTPSREQMLDAYDVLQAAIADHAVTTDRRPSALCPAGSAPVPRTTLLTLAALAITSEAELTREDRTAIALVIHVAAKAA